MKRYIVGITGATGSLYVKRLLEELTRMGHQVHLVASEPGKAVFQHEIGITLSDFAAALPNDKIQLHDNTDLFAPVASGSFVVDGMLVVPCSVATAGRIATGLADSLLTRAADVALKESRPLILGVRETPLSAIHLRNLLTLRESGAVILPPMPAFYHHPETLEDLVDQYVGRLLFTLGLETPLHRVWRGQ